MSKKDVRAAFRNTCFKRDGYRCAMCGWKPEVWNDEKPPLDAHHITDRTLMPCGGYVRDNGISLCDECHLLAETYHITGKAHPGYSPNDLYDKIGSCYDLAVECSLALEYDVQYFELYRTLVIQAKGGEAVLALELNTPVNSTTWELSCEGQGINDPLVLLYGKGRYNGD